MYFDILHMKLPLKKTMSFKGKGELNQGKGERDSLLVSKKCLYLDRGLT